MSKPAYILVNTRTSNPEGLAEYRRLAQVVVAQYGGRYLVRGAPYVTLEGTWQPQRLVVLEFPDMETARRFYDSPEYAVARAARAGVAEFDMLLVEGY